MDAGRPIGWYRGKMNEEAGSSATLVREIRAGVEASEPVVRAFVEEPDRWNRIERRIDELRERIGHVRATPPLAGVPVGVKDIIHVEGLPTRAGTDLPLEAIAGEQGPVIDRLAAAGAVVLGKTVTTEFAYFDPGPTRNPHDTDHTPGGSSSGSAAAVAAGMCPVALGTQTAGSIIRPAAFCGVVGLKPSYDRVPLAGVLPLAESLDHLGVIAASVDDAERAAAVIYDRWVPVSPDRRPVLGVPDDAFLDQADATAREAFQDHRERLVEAGYEIRQVPEALADVSAVNDRHGDLMAAEAALTHRDWYGTFGDRYSDVLADLIDRGRATDVATLGDGRSGRVRVRTELDGVMADHGVDLFIAPAAPGPAPEGLDDTGDPVMNVPWTYAGMPVMTVPASPTTVGLPLGLQCVGRFGEDERLLEWARGIERTLSG